MQNFSITTVIDADTYNNLEILGKSVSRPTSELAAEAVFSEWGVDVKKDNMA